MKKGLLKRIGNQAGMSLIEIMIVLAIIAAATAAIAKKVSNDRERARASQTQGEINELKLKLKEFKVEKGNYPQSWDEMVSSKFVESVPVDGWNQELHLEVPGSHGGKFDIWSDGADETSDTDDDVTSWEKSTQ